MQLLTKLIYSAIKLLPDSILEDINAASLEELEERELIFYLEGGLPKGGLPKPDLSENDFQLLKEISAILSEYKDPEKNPPLLPGESLRQYRERIPPCSLDDLYTRIEIIIEREGEPRLIEFMPVIESCCKDNLSDYRSLFLDDYDF